MYLTYLSHRQQVKEWTLLESCRWLCCCIIITLLYIVLFTTICYIKSILTFAHIHVKCHRGYFMRSVIIFISSSRTYFVSISFALDDLSRIAFLFFIVYLQFVKLKGHIKVARSLSKVAGSALNLQLHLLSKRFRLIFNADLCSCNSFE